VIFLRLPTDVAWENFLQAAKLGEDPALLAREADVPVGLMVCVMILVFDECYIDKSRIESRCHMLCQCVLAGPTGA
jgi:hypothetical protein